MKRKVALVWHAVAFVVFVFAMGVVYALTTGQLDPLGFAYYGVLVSGARTEVLFILLAVLEVFCLVDAVALGWRRQDWRFWAVLGMVVLLLPFCVVVAVSHVDLWRYDRHTGLANVMGGTLMAILIGVPFVMRHWAWRFTAPVDRADADAAEGA